MGKKNLKIENKENLETLHLQLPKNFLATPNLPNQLEIVRDEAQNGIQRANLFGLAQNSIAKQKGPRDKTQLTLSNFMERPKTGGKKNGLTKKLVSELLSISGLELQQALAQKLTEVDLAKNCDLKNYKVFVWEKVFEKQKLCDVV